MSALQNLADKWKDCPICKANLKLLSEYDDSIGEKDIKIKNLENSIHNLVTSYQNSTDIQLNLYEALKKENKILKEGFENLKKIYEIDG